MENVTLHYDWAPALAADIDSSKTQIWISSLSLHPPRHTGTSKISLLWESLKNASMRGISIHFCLAQSAKSHPATGMNQSAATALHKIGVQVTFAPPANLLHAKTATVDDKILWCGSGNWTAAATAHNHESYLRVISPALALKMRQHWHDLSKNWGN